MEFFFRAVWAAFNSVHSYVLHGTQLSVWFWVITIHFVLALATLANGDRSVCDIARPLLKIFKPDAETLIEGTLDIVVAVPRAVIYYGSLYIRAYFLIFRLLFLSWLAMIPALLTTLVLSIIFAIIFGDEPIKEENGLYSKLLLLSIIPAWLYFYWRIDGKRLVFNLQKAFKC